MKCTNNPRGRACARRISVLCIIAVLCLFVTGCGKAYDVDYDIYNSSYEIGLATDTAVPDEAFFSSGIAVVGLDDVGDIPVDSHIAEAAGMFNGNTLECCYAQNVHKKLYPASTTKIMTAHIALKYGDLDQNITVSANAVDQSRDSSVCELKEGDELTLRQLLYGLMLPSGNDAAIAIAEGISGNVDAFVALMNDEAKALGATNTHFANPNGLHDEDHYTTVYDMYMIFNAAIQSDAFVELISANQYIAYYNDAEGNTVEKNWKSSNGYLAEEFRLPEGVTVIGGKTGTTNAAGYCLVLLSRNESYDPIISIVYKAETRTNVYLLTREILEAYANKT